MENVIMFRPELETMPIEKLLEYQLHLFRKQMAYVSERAPFYRRKLDEAGVRPEHIKTLEDVSRIPFTVKDELRGSQEKSPPYGDFHCISPEEGVRVFQTTGTTGIPVRSLLSKKDWLEDYYDQFMYFMYGYGITKADTIFIPFNYGLYLAWWGIHSSFEQGGVLVIQAAGRAQRIASEISLNGNPRSFVEHPLISFSSEKRLRKWGWIYPRRLFGLSLLPENQVTGSFNKEIN